MSKPKYITANKDVNIIYDNNKQEFYLKIPKTTLLKCHIPKDQFMRQVERCFNTTSLEALFEQCGNNKREARLRLSIRPDGTWYVSFSRSSREFLEFCTKVTSTEVNPQEVGELLYKQFTTCNGKVAVDITLWYT